MIELALPGGRVAFSTRRGGMSEGPYESLNVGLLVGDRGERVVENRRRLASKLGLEPTRIAMGWQVHGAEVREWRAPPENGAYAAPGAELDRVDAHTTRLTGVGLFVMVADCLPVALVSRGRAAMLHCGWRGLSEGIVERALAAFEEPPAAAVGPGIGRCCYEVGPEVATRFEHIEGATGNGTLDLRAVARARLAEGGVERLEDVDLCTSCREDLFFSHRRDGAVTGRQAGVAWLTE